MIFFAWIVVLGYFVHTQTLNPRSVNVALETVLEFDGKHNSRDVKAIDKLQNYLNRIKKILTNNDESRRSLPQGFKFRDFLKSALQTIASYDDNDLLDVVAIGNNEIRKYHYKGCRFYELVENQNLRRDMAEKLGSLNDLTAKELRTKLNKAVETIEADKMSEEKKKMLDYLDSVYVGDDIKSKMEILVTQLEQFKKRSKRSNLNLAKVINQGLKSVIFDHYTNLNVNARKELKNRLESFWHDFKNTYNVKDVWKETLTTKAFSVSVNNFEIVYPKKEVVRSKSVKRAKKNKIHLEPRLKTDIKKLKRSRAAHPQKQMSKIVLRKKTNRFKKYKNKDKLRTLKPASVLMTDLSEEDLSVVRSVLATVQDSTEVAKSRLRSAKNRKKLKKGQHKRKHQYIATEPTLMYFKKTRRSNDYDDNSDEGLHIQSFENHKPTISLRRSFTDYSCNDTRGNSVKTTTTTPNVINRMDKIEKVLHEIKDLVSLRRSNNELDEERIVKPKTTTSKIKETERTVTTTQTTKMTPPVTETTTQETTTQENIMKSIIVEEFKSKPQTTKSTKAPESLEEDTKILTETATKSTKTTLKHETESAFTTKEITPKNPEHETTVKTTLTLDVITNDTRRSNTENRMDKSRSVREAKAIGDLYIDTSKTKRSNDNFKDMVKDKLKSIKDHDFSDKERERKFNEDHINTDSKKFNNPKIGKYHEFPDVKHSNEHYLNDNLDEFISDKTKSEKENEFLDMGGIRRRHSEDNFRDIDKEKIIIGKDHNPQRTDKERHYKHNIHDEFKDFERDKIQFDKRSGMEGLSRNNFKDEMKSGKDHEIADAESFSKHNLNNDFKDFDNDQMKFGKRSELIDTEHLKDYAKDKLEFGKEHRLTDLERMHKRRMNELNADKMKIGKEKLTDHDVKGMYESHQVQKAKEKDVNELTDVDIEHMYNETRRAQFDEIIDKNSEGDKDINKRVREKIAVHMKDVMGMKKDGKVPNKFDFSIDDPFNLKEDEFGF